MTEAAGGSARSYRRGSWFGVLGDSVAVLLPPSEKNRVAALWELVDDGAGFDELLDALVASGLRGLPAFALVSDAGETTRVLLRGGPRALFELADGQRVELDSDDDLTWVERVLPGVVSASLVVEESDEDADLRIGGGLVRVARIDQPAYAAPSEPAVPAEEAVPASSEQPAFDPLSDPLPVVEAAAPSPPQFDPDDVDHDGHTVSGGWDPRQFAHPQPGIPGQPPAPRVTAVPVARLVFSSGETVDVDRAVLVGRAPEARRFTSTEQPRLVTVPSPNQEISSTHLEVRPGSGADHGSAVVTDMGSTNGSVLTLPGLVAEDLQPGIAVQLVPGSVIDLGDGVTIHVTHP
jgi:hypothetical protein